jgi:hypothetical protein
VVCFTDAPQVLEQNRLVLRCLDLPPASNSIPQNSHFFITRRSKYGFFIPVHAFVLHAIEQNFLFDLHIGKFFPHTMHGDLSTLWYNPIHFVEHVFLSCTP